jgi:hypothetical protein
MERIADRWEFLIKVTEDYFLAAIERGQVTGTAVLSHAAHFDYRYADKICQGLRIHGYPQAMVVDLFGNPVTVDTFRADAPAPKDDLPRNNTELQKIPAREFKRRYLSDPVFKARVNEIEAAS